VHDGVLHTGDVGFIDEDGYLHVKDRKSLLIIRGGANVYPAEVERVLQEVDGVAASAVVGVPDERLGERVVALIEGTAGEDALRAHCEANLAKYKVPERFVFVDQFPRNAMGKIIRKELPTLL
jgi:acyl-CoA synthetase (AMP-forming)/AMP-acid ligase II